MPVAQKRARIFVKRYSIPEFKYGVICEDPIYGHKIGCLDATSKEDVKKLMAGYETGLAIQDLPYNIDIGGVFTNKGIKGRGRYRGSKLHYSFVVG